MDFNIPVLDQLLTCENLLIAGMGGGFDLFLGLPIYFELQKRGKTVHLASFSFTDVEHLDPAAITKLTPTLAAATADYDKVAIYFPEMYLSRWFREVRNEEVTVWTFHKTGERALTENYRLLVDELGIDGILLVDGGVDSLMRGDEAQMGTLIEDSISLLAVSQLVNVPLRMMFCVGFGAERDIAYGHVLENIADLTQAGAFLGACSLIPQMPVYQDYEAAVLYVQGQRFHDPSTINSSVISAVQGHYGNYHLTEHTRRSGSLLWISPLMPLYWFFDLDTVAARHLFLSQLLGTTSFRHAVHIFMEVRKLLPRRKRSRIPLD